MDNKIKERLLKLRALAMQGVGGERENAQQLLDEMLARYNVSIADLDDIAVRNWTLTYHGAVEEKLLIQVVYKVLNDLSTLYEQRYVRSGRKCRTSKSVRCTEAQKLEIEFLHEFYCRLWKQEVELFLLAFIQKHSIFGDKYRNDKKDERDIDYARMASFIAGMKDETPLKLIEE